MSTETLEILPFEKDISSALVKENITDAAISKLEIEFKDLKLKSLEDREGYLQITEARKQLKNFRITIEKLCKKGRENAVAEQKAWVAKEKELVGKVSVIEDRLLKDEKAFEAEQDRQKEERRRKQEENLFKRQLQLTKMGAEVIDGSFVLEDISVDMLLVKEADDDLYNTKILPPFQVIFDRKQTERVAEENRLAEEKKQREEADAKLKADQEEFDRKKKEFEDQQAVFQKQQQEAENKRLQAIKDAADKKKKDRVCQLHDLGFSYWFPDDSYSACNGTVEISEKSIETDTDEVWDKFISEARISIDNFNQAAEKERLENIEKQKKEAADKALAGERQRVADQQKKDEEEAERKRLEEQQKMDNANDEQKWKLWIGKYLEDITYPEMKGKKWREKISIAMEQIDNIKRL